MLLKRFAEAWVACLTMMVQGNLFELTLDHALKASKTGAISAITFCIATAVFKVYDKVVIATIMGVLTGLTDYMVHPTHFGPGWSEAAATGMIAAILCYLAERQKTQ